MSWGEAWRLTQQLASDPSSSVAAALLGWEHPITREDVMLRALYDLHHRIAWAQGGGKGPKPKPYPRPWATSRRRVKPAASLTQEQILAALREAGHTAPLPT